MAFALRLEGYHTKYAKILWYCLKASENSAYTSDNATLSINAAFKSKQACIDAYDFIIEMITKAMTIISTRSETITAQLKAEYARESIPSAISPAKESANFMTLGNVALMDCRAERAKFQTMVDDARIEPSTMYQYINKVASCAMERSTSIMSCINGIFPLSLTHINNTLTLRYYTYQHRSGNGHFTQSNVERTAGHHRRMAQKRVLYRIF